MVTLHHHVVLVLFSHYVHLRDTGYLRLRSFARNSTPVTVRSYTPRSFADSPHHTDITPLHVHLRFTTLGSHYTHLHMVVTLWFTTHAHCTDMDTPHWFTLPPWMPQFWRITHHTTTYATAHHVYWCTVRCTANTFGCLHTIHHRFYTTVYVRLFYDCTRTITVDGPVTPPLDVHTCWLVHWVRYSHCHTRFIHTPRSSFTNTYTMGYGSPHTSTVPHQMRFTGSTHHFTLPTLHPCHLFVILHTHALRLPGGRFWCSVGSIHTTRIPHIPHVWFWLGSGDSHIYTHIWWTLHLFLLVGWTVGSHVEFSVRCSTTGLGPVGSVHTCGSTRC